MRTFPLLVALASVSLTVPVGIAEEKPVAAGTLQFDSVLVTLIDQRDIPARVEGVLSVLNVQEGQMVEAGEVIAQVEDTEPRLTLNRTRLELEIARKQAQNDVKVRVAKKSRELTQTEYQRAVESAEKYRKAVSETEMDKLRLAAERSALEVEQSEHDLETTRLTQQLKETERDMATHAVDRHKLTSPLAGMVVQVHRRPGEWVQPGTVVARIIRIDRLRVEAFISASQVASDLLGRPVRLNVGLPGKGGVSVDGAIVFVSPEVNPVNGQTRVWAEVDNQKHRLSPGSRGTLIVGPSPAARSQK